MGYQQITVPTGYSLFTITFSGLTSETYDIQDIVPYQSGATLTSNAAIGIQKMDNGGAYLQLYVYRANKGGWCKGLTLQSRGAVTFANGEAMCINNTSGAEIQLQVSGQVVLEPWSAELGTGYSLIGNMTPAQIDIQDIVPYDLDGNVITTPAVVGIQKMDSTGAYLQLYVYRANKGGWCKGLTYQAPGTITFEPGESACLNNTSGAGIKLKFKEPVASGN